MMKKINEEYTVHIGFRVLDSEHGVEETNEIIKIEIPHLGEEEAIDAINASIDAIRAKRLAMKNSLVVTRHKALVEYLRGEGLITSETPVRSHATAKDVANKNVIGVLPLSLAKLAASITEVPLSLQMEDRGKELSLDRVAEFAQNPVTYKITEI